MSSRVSSRPARHRPLRAVLLFRAVALLFLALAIPACSGGKTYSFPKVRIDATVNQDGSLRVVEQRTFDFHGAFHFAYFTVEHRQFDDIVDLSIEENGFVYEPGAEGSPGRSSYEDNVLEGPGGFKFKATWWFAAQDEERTFTISYTVLCAVDVYADTAHLLWKFVGEGWTVPTDAVLVTLHLPGHATSLPPRPDSSCTPQPSDLSTGVAETPPPIPTTPLARGEVRAWGHGPLQGVVRIPEPQTVVLDVSDVGPGTFVEGSVLFPTDAVPYAYRSAQNARPKILSDEAAMARRANDERRHAQADDRRHRLWRRVTAGVAVGLALIALGLVLVARRRDKVLGVPRIAQEPPEEDLHPSLLAERWALVHHRRGGIRNAFRSQILQLAKDRAVEITPIGTVSTARDFELTLLEVPSDPLDETFCDFLFAGDEAVHLNELEPNEGQRKDLRDWWEQVAKGARAPLDGGGGRFETRILWWLAWTSPLWGFMLSFLGDLRPGLAWLVVLEAFVLAYAAHRLVPRRLAGASDRERLARWAAFRRFLRRFSSLPDAPAAAVVIWEQYLVFAAALGVADLVERQVRAIVPVETLPAPWPGAPSGLDAMQVYRTFQSISFGTLVVTASSSPSTGSSGSSGSTSWSSSGGSGGGFSSGGGGGGGGTGGGAG